MDRRYTDHDVRSNPDLKSIAVNYLIGYGGNFELLVNARDMVRGYGAGSLNNQQIRAVLNSMLADPSVINMPIPLAAQPFDAQGVTDYRKLGSAAVNGDLDAMDQRAVELLKQRLAARAPKPRIKVRARWLYDYGISNHKQALAVHRVDHDRCNAVLNRTFSKMEPDHVDFSFYWMCAGYGTPKPYEKTLVLFDMKTAHQLVRTGDASHVVGLTKGVKVRAWKACRTCNAAYRRG